MKVPTNMGEEDTEGISPTTKKGADLYPQVILLSLFHSLVHSEKDSALLNFHVYISPGIILSLIHSTIFNEVPPKCWEIARY